MGVGGFGVGAKGWGWGLGVGVEVLGLTQTPQTAQRNRRRRASGSGKRDQDPANTAQPSQHCPLLRSLPPQKYQGQILALSVLYLPYLLVFFRSREKGADARVEAAKKIKILQTLPNHPNIVHCYGACSPRNVATLNCSGSRFRVEREDLER